MTESVPEAPYDDGSEADRRDQDVPAVPETVDPEDDPTPAEFGATSEGSEADWLDQTEEVDIDDEQLNRG